MGWEFRIFSCSHIVGVHLPELLGIPEKRVDTYYVNPKKYWPHGIKERGETVTSDAAESSKDLEGNLLIELKLLKKAKKRGCRMFQKLTFDHLRNAVQECEKNFNNGISNLEDIKDLLPIKVQKSVWKNLEHKYIDKSISVERGTLQVGLNKEIWYSVCIKGGDASDIYDAVQYFWNLNKKWELADFPENYLIFGYPAWLNYLVEVQQG